jgi:ribosomal protein L12E/L44/L45/RPP1/RPP2
VSRGNKGGWAEEGDTAASETAGSGNASPSAADIKTVFGAVGVKADSECLDMWILELTGKDINEVCGHIK